MNISKYFCQHVFGTSVVILVNNRFMHFSPDRIRKDHSLSLIDFVDKKILK